VYEPVEVALVAIGGALGALARWGFSSYVQRFAELFPIGTLSVNIVGSLLLGFIMASSKYYGAFPRNWRLLLATGFCGSFTTFSTFSYETFTLLLDAPLYGILNLTLNIIGGLAAIYTGYLLAGVIYARG
jgi:CrcB protein